MTQENKEYMGSGLLLGIIITIMFIGLIGFLNWLNDPINVMHPNQALNSPDITIDTINTINGTNTTTTYQFRRIK